MYIDISIPVKLEVSNSKANAFDEIPTHSIFIDQHMVFGTHLDLPNVGAEIVEFDNLVGECLVVKIPESAKAVELGHLLKLPLIPGGRVIFKTKNSSGWQRAGYPPNPIGIDIRAAQFLADRKLKLVGIDGWSVDKKDDPNLISHTLLLESGSYLLESLYLDHVAPGNYQVLALPLMIQGARIVPCRAVLQKEDRL